MADETNIEQVQEVKNDQVQEIKEPEVKKHKDHKKLKDDVKSDPTIIRWFKNLFPTKSDQENVFQYIIRQFFFADTRGVPSITVTLLVFVMAILGAVALVEIRNAMIMVKYFNAAGTIIKVAPNGFSEPFLYLVIGLSVVITGWYRQRQNKTNSTINSASLIDTAKTYVSSIVSKINTGTTTPTNQNPGGK